MTLARQGIAHAAPDIHGEVAVPHHVAPDTYAHEQRTPAADRTGRRWVRAGLGVAMLVLASSTACSADQLAPNGGDTSVPAATAPQAPDKFADHALALADPTVIGMSDNDLEKRMDLIDESKAQGLRTDLPWYAVQPTEGGTYNWSKFDPIAKSAKEHGQQVLAILDYAPQWAASPDCDTAKVKCAPKDPAKFGDFAVAAVTRYAPEGIHNYEIWNEQNISARWGPAVNATTYADVVRQTCPRIKKADPQAVVIAGGLAKGDGPRDVPMVEFVRQFQASNPGDCYDALAVHYYDAKPETLAQLWAVHQVMADQHNNRPVWGTEVGVDTSGPCGAPDNPSEIHQAQTLTSALQTWRSYDWTGPAFVFMTQDNPAGNNYFGLTCKDPAGTKKPAFDQFQKLAAG